MWVQGAQFDNGLRLQTRGMSNTIVPKTFTQNSAIRGMKPDPRLQPPKSRFRRSDPAVHPGLGMF